MKTKTHQCGTHERKGLGEIPLLTFVTPWQWFLTYTKKMFHGILEFPTF